MSSRTNMHHFSPSMDIKRQGNVLLQIYVFRNMFEINLWELFTNKVILKNQPQYQSYDWRKHKVTKSFQKGSTGMWKCCWR